MTNQHASSSSAGNDPAASMSLLKAILENPLDAGYGTYHEKASRGVTSVFHRTITILIAIALGIGAGFAISGLRAQAQGDVHSSLLSHAQTQTQQITQMRDEVATLRTHVKELSAQQGQSSIHENAATALANADTQVSGPGLKVTLTDAANAVSSRQSGQG
ncbi:MAG: DUF881 domain-containing protein, partial [Actinomyces sp.]|nr:DUF881 domain-containing protein [Actinomyces sp.]